MLIGFLIDFWSHLGAKIASKTAQDGPKTRPRRPLGPNLPRTAEILLRIAEILPKTKPKTRTLPTTAKERPTSKRSAAKLPADRRAPELQTRGAAVLPPRGSSIMKHMSFYEFYIDLLRFYTFLMNFYDFL